MAFPAYPFIQSFVNELLILQKPRCFFSKVIHGTMMGPGLPQTRALVTNAERTPSMW